MFKLTSQADRVAFILSVVDKMEGPSTANSITAGDLRQVLEQEVAKRPRLKPCVAEHRELFGAQAGSQLAEEIFEGRAHDLSALQVIAQVPDSSWLWKRIFVVLLSRIFLLDDETFLKRLPELV